MPNLLLGLVLDEMVADAVAQTAGFSFRHIRHCEEIEPPSAKMRVPGEPLIGLGAGFIVRLVEWQPALVLVELNQVAIPWEAWVAALKSSPATRRIPVLGFSAQVDMALHARANEIGCDVVFNTAALLKDLPSIIAQYARRQNPALEVDCERPLSELAREGIALHNRGEYFEAHEALEHAWNEEASAARELYRGLLQVSVAYLQIERGNYNGALKMFLRLRQWLDPLPDFCRGVHVAQVRQDALTARVALEELGPNNIHAFDRNLFKPFLVTGGA